MKTINIAIVDDKQLICDSLSDKLKLNSTINILFTASNGIDFLEKMKNSDTLPDIVFMDIDMPKMNGIEAIDRASELYPSTRFLILTVFDDDEKIFDAIKAGAVGYLLKEERPERLIKALEEVLVFGGAPMSPSIARKSLRLLSQGISFKKNSEESPLTERETEILQKLVEGKDYKRVANDLFLSPHTIRTHTTNIYKKLHVSNKIQAINLSKKKGWL